MKYIYNFLQNVKLTDFWNSLHLDYMCKTEKLGRYDKYLQGRR